MLLQIEYHFITYFREKKKIGFENDKFTSFIHILEPLSHYSVLIECFVPGTVLGTGVIPGNRIDKILILKQIAL